MLTPGVPDLAGFETYFGLELSDIGEDGNVIILGHHPDQPLRIIAALNQHSRRYWGLTNLLDAHDARLEDLAGTLLETWAVNTARCGDDHDVAEDCPDCVKISKHEWCIRWGRYPGELGAFPTTVFIP